jgi:hypothetical protein
MKLTHEQVTRLQELFRSFSGVMGEEYSEDKWVARFGLFSSGYQNGFKDGAEAMRERCVKIRGPWDITEHLDATPEACKAAFSVGHGTGWEDYRKAIRALPLDIDNKGGR